MINRIVVMLATALIFTAVVVGDKLFVLPKGERGEANERLDPEAASYALRQKILHATDLIDGIATALVNNNDAAISSWQQKALEVAKAAQLTERDIDFIGAQSGRDYLIFHARRQLFNLEFERRYLELEEIETLKLRYPQAGDLFASVDKLIADRDGIITDIAKVLSEPAPPNAESLEQAKLLWQQRVKEKSTANP